MLFEFTYFTEIFFQPYFCGQYDECSLVQSKWALEKAKSNIEAFYPVVAVLEDLDNTFFVLENKLPKFFSGISKLYYETLKSNEYFFHKIIY